MSSKLDSDPDPDSHALYPTEGLQASQPQPPCCIMSLYCAASTHSPNLIPVVTMCVICGQPIPSKALTQSILKCYKLGFAPLQAVTVEFSTKEPTPFVKGSYNII